MPSLAHELPLEMVRNRPQVVPVLLRELFDIPISADVAAALTSETYADTHPAELRCDATVLLGDPERPDYGVVVESQLRFDKDKTFSWPAYLASLRLRLRCPVALLVICPDETTARACARPILMGHPGWELAACALHPGRLRPVTDSAHACRFPELAVLSAPSHADGPYAREVIDSLAAAIDTLTPDIGALYYDYIQSRISDAARKLLEESMKLDNYQWQSEFARTHIAQGRAEGRAEGQVEGQVEGKASSVFLVLDARGISVPDHIRRHITDCTDIDQLDHWIQRAATVDAAERLLG
jgi:hypothetical protein